MYARIYPKADFKSQWWDGKYARATFARVEKFLLHSTETTGWPSYDGGAKAPTLTYFCKTRQWRQHNYINNSARALADPDSTPVRENRDNVVQLEIIGYADEIIGKSVGGVLISELSDDNLKDIGEFLAWLHAEWECPIQNTLEWPAYRPYKNVRLTSSQYDAYRGVLGHMHAPGNSHTDPGNININKIIAYAKGNAVQEDDEVTPQDVKAIADAVWARKPFGDPKPGQEGGYPNSSAANNLGWQSLWAQSTNKNVQDLLTKVTAMEGALKALADGTDVDVDAFKAAAQEAFENALKSTLTVSVEPTTPEPTA